MPEGLSKDGWKLKVMVEVYGNRLAEELDDPPWIEDATRAGWVILTKDFKSLRYRPPFETIKREGARVFALANAGLPGNLQLAYFLACKHKILAAAKKPGPYIYKVYERTIDRAWP